MKRLTLITITLVLLALWNCAYSTGLATTASAESPTSATFTGQVYGHVPAARVELWDGFHMERLAIAELEEDGSFTISAPAPQPNGWWLQLVVVGNYQWISADADFGIVTDCDEDGWGEDDCILYYPAPSEGEFPGNNFFVE